MHELLDCERPIVAPLAQRITALLRALRTADATDTRADVEDALLSYLDENAVDLDLRDGRLELIVNARGMRLFEEFFWPFVLDAYEAGRRAQLGGVGIVQR